MADDSPDESEGRKDSFFSVGYRKKPICSEFDQCPRSVHRELRNRFFDWFYQIEELEHQSQYYGKIFLKKKILFI